MKSIWSLGVGVAALAVAALAAPAEPRPAVVTPDKKIDLFDGKTFAGWRLYLPGNADPKATWSVKEGKIVCTGKPAGYMRTEKRWTNYKLHVEWRYPAEPSNSGVFLHIQDFDTVWPKCIETQLKSRDAGDFIMMGQAEVDAVKGTQNRRIAKLAPCNEVEPGQWNTMEIVCKGDTIEVKVNGAVQNKATGSTITQGFIGLQSEGGLIEFRNVTIEPAP